MPKLYRLSPVIDGLYVGGGSVVFYADDLRQLGLTRVLKLYVSHPASPPWPDDLTIGENPVKDGMPIPPAALERGVAFIRDGLAAGEKVLVVCSLGVSRSPAFVMAYLLERGYDLPEAWRLLKTRYPPAAPRPAMWQTLLSHYRLPYTMDDVAGWLDGAGEGA